MQEDKLNIHHVKGVTEKAKKSLVAQATVSNFLLEYQLRVTPPKTTEIKSQLAIHEVIVILLEPMDFKTIATKAAAWK